LSENNKNKLAIEQFLPADFLYLIGAYLQTCAHIEQATCALITCLGGLRPADQEWFKKYCETRKLPTSELLKSLRASSDDASEFGFAEELRSLCDWVENFKSNRHMAAHGAFVGSQDEFLRVDYVHNTATRKNPNYEREHTAITRNLVEDACSDANRIYLIVLGLLETIETGLTIEVARVAFPIVTHPSSTQR